MVMYWSYCVKPEELPHTRSVLDLPKTEECGVAARGDDVEENVWSRTELDVEDEKALDVLRFCNVDAAMPSELAFATSSASTASSVRPALRPSTSVMYTSWFISPGAMLSGVLGGGCIEMARDPILTGDCVQVGDRERG